MLFALVCCLNNYNEALMPKVKIRQHTKERKKTKVVIQIRRKRRKLQCAIYFFCFFLTMPEKIARCDIYTLFVMLTQSVMRVWIEFLCALFWHRFILEPSCTQLILCEWTWYFAIAHVHSRHTSNIARMKFIMKNVALIILNHCQWPQIFFYFYISSKFIFIMGSLKLFLSRTLTRY